MGTELEKAGGLLAARPAEVALRAEGAARGAPGGVIAFAALIVAMASVMLLPVAGTAQLAGWAMVGGAWVVGQVAHGTISQTRFIRRSLELVNSGRLEEAVVYCTEWTRGKSRFPHRLGMVQTAYATLRAGRHTEALAIFAEVDRAGAPGGVLRAARAGVASILALLGHVEAAVEKLDEDLGEDTTGLPYARTLIYCCAGRYDEIFSLRLRPRSRRVVELLAHEVRCIMLLRAFAADKLGSDRETLERALGAAHPTFEGEYGYLLVGVDGLGEFVDGIDWASIPRAHGISFDEGERLPTASVVRR